MATPVLLVKIPKAKGGFRQLGIPTVSSRVAQTVIKNRLDPILEEKFHEDSFAYRPNKSAIAAVKVCRERCFRHEWLLEIDIKGFFDNSQVLTKIIAIFSINEDKNILINRK